jgi:deoxyribodipyrimidine photolyase-related protein
MERLILILGDQLNFEMNSLQNFDPKVDKVLMAEVNSEATYVKHHKKKLAFVFSAMRHFALAVKEKGWPIDYYRYDAKDNGGSLAAHVERAVQNEKPKKVVVCHPGEYRLLEEIKGWSERFDVEVEICEDNRFIAEQTFFSRWAEGKKQFRMEFFYRELRKQTSVLMEGKQPIGGKWNYDADNRDSFKTVPTIPEPSSFPVDDITQEVLELVENKFLSHFGTLEGFHFAVDRKGALQVLHTFIEERLCNFGQYQDAMLEGDPWLYHSHIGLYLNTGLLMPLEVIQVAEQAYYDQKAPLNSVEGFIRQVLGWREYVRGFYWHFMPNLKTDNYLNAKRRLPNFYWDAKTKMNCLAQCVSDTREHAYAHHIQRLMVLGNFALLAGIHPDELNEWYLLVYADAYEWVELPNVSAMVLFSDGGNLASKPYGSSGAYINKMSNYCKNCHYSVKEKTGEQACPFNYMYWHFLHRNKSKFENNPRMAMIYRTFGKMDDAKVSQILEDGDIFLHKLENNEEV